MSFANIIMDLYRTEPNIRKQTKVNEQVRNISKVVIFVYSSSLVMREILTSYKSTEKYVLYNYTKVGFIIRKLYEKRKSFDHIYHFKK